MGVHHVVVVRLLVLVGREIIQMAARKLSFRSTTNAATILTLRKMLDILLCGEIFDCVCFHWHVRPSPTGLLALRSIDTAAGLLP